MNIDWKGWKGWKVWTYFGMVAFAIVLCFLFFTNRNSFYSASENFKKKYKDKNDDIDNQQKKDAVDKVVKQSSSIEEAEKRLHSTVTKYDSKIQETKQKGTNDEEIDDLNKYMGN